MLASMLLSTLKCNWASYLIKNVYMLGLPFSSKLDWGSYNVSKTKTASNKTQALMKFLSPEVDLYL